MTHDHLGIVGKTIGDKYVVEAAVGEGSFSYVYRAMHLVWRRAGGGASQNHRSARAGAESAVPLSPGRICDDEAA